MMFAYDTAAHPAILFPTVTKAVGSAVGSNLDSINGAALTGSFPVTFNTSDFQPYTFDFVGDVDLFQEDSVWVDTADRTQLKPGTYHSTGTITLRVTDVRGQVTLIGKDILLSDERSKLTAFSKGVLLFATGVAANGIAVQINGSDHLLTGIIYAPQGKVEIRASRLFNDGSVFSNGFDWPGSNSRIAFSQDLFQE